MRHGQSMATISTDARILATEHVARHSSDAHGVAETHPSTLQVDYSQDYKLSAAVV